MAVHTTEASPDLQRLRSQYTEIATLAGGLAHEIRNPLSTIRLNLELLSEDLDGSEAARDRRMQRKLQTVLQECSRLERLLDDFLQFARAGKPNLVPADLNEQVRAFLDFYAPQAAEHRIELSPLLAAHLPSVELDPRLFRQVLQNLVRNAQEAMPDGGRLEVLTYVQDGRVMLELIDNGCGMDDETSRKLFETFFSTKPGGSGLGLATAQRILTEHGATIACESAPARGTRFRIAFP